MRQKNLSRKFRRRALLHDRMFELILHAKTKARVNNNSLSHNIV